MTGVGYFGILKRMSIQTRLTLTISALITSTLVAAFLIWGLTEFVHLKNEQTREQQLTLEKLCGVCREAALNQNDVILMNYIELLKSTPGFVYAAFLDSRRVTRVHSDPALLSKILDDPVSRAGAQAEAPLRQVYVGARGSRIVDWAAPVNNNGRRLGTARLGLDEEALRRVIRGVLTLTLRRFLWVAIGSLFVGFLGAAFLARGFNRPITQLSEGVRKIGEGDLDCRLDLSRSDELGYLAGEFNRMAQKLKELDELKESFLNNISHEMRSPLTAILGYVGVLAADKKTVPSPLMTKSLKIIQDEAKRLAGFINDILDLAKMQADKIEFDFREMDLATLAREVGDLFRPNAEQCQIRLNLAIDDAPDPAAFHVRGDREALRRVLVNLVSNALKFTPNNGVVQIFVQDRGQELMSGVQDNGIGIPKESIDKLFTKFTQVKETRNMVRKVSGTGLGLALAKEIVEAHGGRIGVASEINKGAAFYFILSKQGPAVEPASGQTIPPRLLG